MSEPHLSHLIRATPDSAPRRARAEWLVPVLLIAGFLTLAALMFRDRLMPGTPVDVGRVLAIPVAAGQPVDAGEKAAAPAVEPAQAVQADASAPMLFQASGWLEPAPYPIRVAALVSGVVKAISLKEGDEVREGEELATLIDEDARLAVEAARSAHDRALAEVKAAESELEAARNRFGAQTARAGTEKAKLEETRDLHARFEGLPGGAVSETERVVARLAVVRAEASLAEQAALATEAASDITRRERLLEVARANVKAAAVGLAEAELAMTRTRILSPIRGRLQRLLVAPGAKLVVDGDEPDGALVAVLYNPGSLQARVDVALADAAGLLVGQAARIRCGLLPDTVFHGVVTNLAGQADVQRNTLQAKVAIHAPDPRMRPEMLCRVEFLASVAGRTAGAKTGGNSEAGGEMPEVVAAVDIYVPGDALIDAAGESAAAWVVEPESLRTARRSVTLGSATRDGHRQVLDGLRPGEWVVLRPGGALEDGGRVRIANNKGNPNP